MPTHHGRSLIWALVESGGLSVLSLAVLFFAARVLGPTELGAAALAIGIVQTFSIVTDTLLHDAIVQRSEVDEEHLDTAFWVCLVLGVVFAIGLWLCSSLIGRMFGNADLASLIAVAGLSLSFSGAGSVAIAVLRRNFLFKALALRSLMGRLFGAVVAIGFVFAGYGVWSLVAQYLIQTVMNTVMVWPSSPWRPRFRFNPARLKELLSFGLFSVGTRIVWLSSARLFTILVGYFLGVTSVGYLNVAQRVVDTLHDMLAGAAYNLALPIFSRKQHDLMALTTTYCTATEFGGLSVQPLFGAVAVCATSIVELFLGDTWLPSALLIQILAVAAMLQFACLFANAVIVAVGKPGYIFFLSLVSFVFVLVTFLVFPPSSVYAAGTVWGSRTLLIAPILVVLLHRLLDRPAFELFKGIFAPTVGTAVMMLAIWIVHVQLLVGRFSPLETLLIELPLGALVYLAVIAIIRREALLRLGLFVIEGIRGGARVPGSSS
jgi:PST family polysaccharide transporter